MFTMSKTSAPPPPPPSVSRPVPATFALDASSAMPEEASSSHISPAADSYNVVESEINEDQAERMVQKLLKRK